MQMSSSFTPVPAGRFARLVGLPAAHTLSPMKFSLHVRVLWHVSLLQPQVSSLRLLSQEDRAVLQ